MSYHPDKQKLTDAQINTHTDPGNDNTRRPKRPRVKMNGSEWKCSFVELSHLEMCHLAILTSGRDSRLVPMWHFQPTMKIKVTFRSSWIFLNYQFSIDTDSYKDFWQDQELFRVKLAFVKLPYIGQFIDRFGKIKYFFKPGPRRWH